jgi:deferrochelatase/peroxidase EfeB
MTGPTRDEAARPFPWDKFGVPPPPGGSGDLILQICGDDLYVGERVVRRVEEELSASVRVSWSQFGTQRYTTRPGRSSREEGRALIGFIDGSSNLKPRNNADDAKLVFIDPDPTVIGAYPANPAPEPGATGPYANTTTGPRFPIDLPPVPTSEPVWTKHGTYMTVRVSTFDTTPWDDLSQNQQEHAVGRFRSPAPASTSSTTRPTYPRSRRSSRTRRTPWWR